MLLSDTKVKELLLASKTLNKKSLDDLVLFAANFRISLQDAVVEKGILSDEALGSITAKDLHMPFVSLAKTTIPEIIFHIVPERIARKYKVIAFAEDAHTVKLGINDPTHKDLVDMIAKKTDKKVITYFATQADITTTLQMYQKNLQESVDELLRGNFRSNLNLLDDAPVTKIVDLLITFAYREKASDIHIEPEEDSIVVRFRIDSILQDVAYLDKLLLNQIVTRIKVLSRLQTDEHLSPQDGKMRMFVDDENIDIRVSILPATEGEKVVMRLLSSKFRQFSLADLGMSKEDLRKVTNALHKSYGLILSTGPTGSGKTTTIYSLLKTLNSREKNITTIEDPVEYRIKGVTQIQVNAKTKLSFANGLRSILRQDPNIIFVGEIRDSETGRIAVNAALTGHLVLSTLHTNDAATTLPRLIDMSVEPFLVASTVSVIIAQRLVRKICSACRETISRDRKELIKDLSEKTLVKYFGKDKRVTLYHGKGCRLCHFTGFMGRVGIFEVIEISEEIRRLIVQKRDANDIQKQAVSEGMTTMLDDGLAKVLSGITTLEEVLRVMKTESL